MHIDPQTTIYIDLLRTVPTSGLLALFEKLPAVFILMGGSVAILSFLGCCGACVDSACFISLVRDVISIYNRVFIIAGLQGSLPAVACLIVHKLLDVIKWESENR